MECPNSNGLTAGEWTAVANEGNGENEDQANREDGIQSIRE